MEKILGEILTGNFSENYICPFIDLNDSQTKEDTRAVLEKFHEQGVHSVNVQWREGNPLELDRVSKFNDTYFEHMQWVIDACRELGMTFLVQDAAPFPTGSADGEFAEPENRDLNKLYLSEHHADVKGPLPDAQLRIDLMTHMLHEGDLDRASRGIFPFTDDHILAVAAWKKDGQDAVPQSAVDLTEKVEDGILYWDVPEGIWRIYCLFETHNGGGRRFYMNLLDRDSVALHIRAIHELHYEKWKDELHKTWLGFFYDETEIGNLPGYCYDDLPGSEMPYASSSQVLPWSKEMPELMRKALGEDYAMLLPLLWIKGDARYRQVRYRFMDVITKQIRENYNGQVHAWCRERGILYIGHNLEDENSHAHLACGPGHIFRMQAHQDMAGIDLISGQLMPGKDFEQAWYGCDHGDGEFYHYGLAKLASSNAHINPVMKGRSFCEVFALYGFMTGTKLRRFILDHLFADGINHLIPADAGPSDFPVLYSRMLNDYSGRMCHLLNNTKPLIRAAILYHAEAEWYEPLAQKFQKAAKVLAEHQISYDVIPADVFSMPDFYHTDLKKGLCINGNSYEILLIPGCMAIPEAAALFLRAAEKTGFPILFVDKAPEVIAETGRPLDGISPKAVCSEDLAAAVLSRIHPDLVTADFPALRYSHLKGEEGDFYFLHNEAGACERDISLAAQGNVYRIGLENGKIIRLQAVNESGHPGFRKIHLSFGEYEAVLLYTGPDLPDVSAEDCEGLRKNQIAAEWKVQLQSEESFSMKELRNLNAKDLSPRFGGRCVYTAAFTAGEQPLYLDLGRVNDACTVYVNDICVGSAAASPYRFDIREAARPGENRLRVEAYCTSAHTGLDGIMAIQETMMAHALNVLPPNGMLGPVNYYTRQQ